MAPASSHFITAGKYTRFDGWCFIHNSGLNMVPFKANKRGILPAARACRKCGKWDETLPHVIYHCPSLFAAWQTRHNVVFARIRAAVTFKCTILSEKQNVGPNGLRQDLVTHINNKIYITDVTIPFENTRQAFNQAREKGVQNLDLLHHFSTLGL
ncbi:uncharacterized protein TNIN_174661 [Trichonephila inaurata madagascariensis]|uniref:Uncharacterized protein n=1 Tax=Trichonephila inaurata madagascariensis TaxID=2747483 RepID=A0A8X7C3W1_9ARAC|nr:uncharacterized protein TNIN_72641 [Trichonephila inaurata madagascariensis]GFY51649.1 uncharacterized protein TNIN_174661 [Trichonephila inaurata madagascariensis]